MSDKFRFIGESIEQRDVIASQCSHWRGNPFLLAKPEEFGDADRHGPAALAMTEENRNSPLNPNREVGVPACSIGGAKGMAKAVYVEIIEKTCYHE